MNSHDSKNSGELNPSIKEFLEKKYPKSRIEVGKIEKSQPTSDNSSSYDKEGAPAEVEKK